MIVKQGQYPDFKNNENVKLVSKVQVLGYTRICGCTNFQNLDDDFQRSFQDWQDSNLVERNNKIYSEEISKFARSRAAWYPGSTNFHCFDDGSRGNLQDWQDSNQNGKNSEIDGKEMFGSLDALTTGWSIGWLAQDTKSK
ncbi:hypothetical protein B9Z55_010120 [Caenorhabditis nigoni]|nr:hypothetical protein B9Z55_010120 [Caenorhabditis nigoni]